MRPGANLKARPSATSSAASSDISHGKCPPSHKARRRPDRRRPAGRPDLTLSFDLLWRGIELTTGAQREHRYEQLGTWPIRISRLERGLEHDSELAGRYEAWLTAHNAA